MAPRSALLAAACAACAVPEVHAWGHEGHWIVGRIAAQLLGDDATLQKAKGVLGGKSLEDVASWADELRENTSYHWSERLHFIDLPDKACEFVWDRDCREDACVAGAVVNYTKRLQDRSLSEEERDIALRFVVHFVGDAHQPLHVGWTSDRGGNTIHVKEGFAHDKSENLHEVWDVGIVDQFEDDHRFNQTGYAQLLLKVAQAGGTDVEKWSMCGQDLKACVLETVEESASLACESAYRDETTELIRDGEELTQKYYETRSKVISARLTAAAVRLASVLRVVFRDGVAAADGATVVIV